MPKLEVQRKGDGVVIPVRVAPRASRSAILGVHDGALKVALTAPPVDGAANAGLRKLLAKALHVPKSAVTIIRGDKARDKLIHVTGVDPAAVEALTNVD